MEVVSPRIKSSCLDISSSHGSPTDLVGDSSTDLYMNDLKACLTELLNIEDIEISANGISPSIGEGEKGRDIPVGDFECGGADQICSSNSKSHEIVVLDGKEKHEENTGGEVSKVNGSSKHFNQCFSQSISQPTPSKLVSAMKGSREKEGKPPKKLSVTWAPDVYDPIPTSISHVPSNKNQRYRNDGKKHGKHKQKSGGKSARGSRGKVKGQRQKASAEEWWAFQ